MFVLNLCTGTNTIHNPDPNPNTTNIKYDQYDINNESINSQNCYKNRVRHTLIYTYTNIYRNRTVETDKLTSTPQNIKVKEGNK